MRYVCRVRSFAAASIVAGWLVLPAPCAGQEMVPALESAVRDSTFERLKVPAELTTQLPRPQTRSLRDAASRPAPLLPLYASLGVLQGLDIHSTTRGVSSGRAREANPVMEPIVQNRAAFIAVKAATMAGVVWASERLWRRRNRKAAVVLTAVTNIGLAAVVAHNYRAAR